MNKEAAGKKRLEKQNPVARKRDGLKSARATAAGQAGKTERATARRISSDANPRRNI